MRGGTAYLERRGIEHTGALAEIVFGIEIYGDRNASRGATGNEKSLGDFRVALGFCFAILRREIGAEIEKAAETGARIDKAGRGEIESGDFELGIDGSEGSVRLVDGAGGSVELEFPAGRKVGSDSDGKLGGHGKVGGHDVHVIVGAAFLAGRGTDDNAAILERKFLDGKIGG